MARASAWGLGTALAYRDLDIDAQADLLARYAAHRTREGEEAEGVVFGALVKFAGEAISVAREKGLVGLPGSTWTSPPPPVAMRKTQRPPSPSPLNRDTMGDRMSVEDMLRLRG